MNPSACQPLKRGWPAQRQRREAERDARRHAVAFDHWAGAAGPDGTRGRPSSLAWPAAPWPSGNIAGAKTTWPPSPLGRPCHRSDPRTRNEAIGLMRSVGLGISAAAVQAAFPDIGPPRGPEPPRPLSLALPTGRPAAAARPPLAPARRGLGHGPCRAPDGPSTAAGLTSWPSATWPAAANSPGCRCSTRRPTRRSMPCSGCSWNMARRWC